MDVPGSRGSLGCRFSLAHLVWSVFDLPEELVHLIGHSVGFAVGALGLYNQLVVTPRSADEHIHHETVVGDVFLDEATALVAVVLHVRREWCADDVVSALVGELTASGISSEMIWREKDRMRVRFFALFQDLL